MDIVKNTSFCVSMQKASQKGLEKHEAEFGSCSSSTYSILAKFSPNAHALCSKQEKENNNPLFFHLYCCCKRISIIQRSL